MMSSNLNNRRWTLNCDLGEGAGNDAEVMPLIDCANICTGSYASDRETILATLQLARAQSVRIGAHPGYPDRANFGRLSLDWSAQQIVDELQQQLTDFKTLCDDCGVVASYVKPHGALNNDMAKKPSVFAAVCQGIAEFDASLALMAPWVTERNVFSELAQQQGIALIWEVFADRAYTPAGFLQNRRELDAVYSDSQQILRQIAQIQTNFSIISVDGSLLKVDAASSICLHGDHAPSIVALTQLHQPPLVP